MRARLRSYGLSSTRTRSPGRMRMRKRRILPATCPRTSWPLSSCTLNIAFGSASTTSPSNSTFSSLGIGRTVPAPARAHARRKRTYGGGAAGAPGGGGAPLGPAGGGVRAGGGVVAVGARLAGLQRAPRVRVGGVVARLVALHARRGVLAEERRGVERHLRQREVTAVLAVGHLHVGAPDRRGHLAAGHAGTERAAVGRVANPPRRRQVRREADEPGVGEVVH